MYNIISKLALLGVLLVLGYMSLLIIIRYPDNHGSGTGVFRWIFLAVVLVAGGYFFSKNGFALSALVLALIGLLLTWAVDYRNIMVDYDKWIVRGMPSWGEITDSK